MFSGFFTVDKIQLSNLREDGFLMIAFLKFFTKLGIEVNVNAQYYLIVFASFMSSN